MKTDEKQNTGNSIANDYIFGTPTANVKHGIANESDLLMLEMQSTDKVLPNVVGVSEDFGPESDVDAFDESTQRNLLQEEHEQFFSEFASPVVIVEKNLNDDIKNENSSINLTEIGQSSDETFAQQPNQELIPANSIGTDEIALATIDEFNNISDRTGMYLDRKWLHNILF